MPRLSPSLVCGCADAHCLHTCRWCWEHSCSSLEDAVHLPYADFRPHLASVAEYGRLNGFLPDSLFAFGHERRVGR